MSNQIELIDVEIFERAAGSIIGNRHRLTVVFANGARMTTEDIIQLFSRLRVLNVLCYYPANRVRKQEIKPLQVNFNAPESDAQLIQWLHLIRDHVPEAIVKQIKPAPLGYAPLLSFFHRLITDVESWVTKFKSPDLINDPRYTLAVKLFFGE